MNLLLDTHIFIWWDSQPERLSSQAESLLHDPKNSIYLSIVSVWEMQIKQQLNKLQFHKPLFDLVENQQRSNGLKIMPIQLEHIYALDKLPLIHKDPFDRLLIAQAQIENLILVSVDAAFSHYPIVVKG